MASLEQIVQSTVDRLEEIPDSFIALVNKQNEVLWKELLKALKSLESVNGVIQPTPANLAQVEIIAEKMRQVLAGGEYLEAVASFVGQFDSQAVLLNQVYKLQFDEFADKNLYKLVLDQSKKSALALFDIQAVDRQWIEPLKNIINNNIITQGSYNDMLGVLQEFALGSAEKDAALTRYAQLYARDSFNIFNRNYSQIIANDLDVQYFEYFGQVIKDTRPFCMERVGKTFSKAEIESWASLSWQGKNPNTDKSTIFTYCGGYNCIHTLVARADKAGKEKGLNTYNDLPTKDKK
jgi:hypothetical protein